MKRGRHRHHPGDNFLLIAFVIIVLVMVAGLVLKYAAGSAFSE